MKKARLLKLARFVERVPPQKFDMNFWARAKGPVTRLPRCATKACALGWATAIPEFKRAGLELIAECPGGDHAEVHFDGSTGRSAAMKFFDLDYDESEIFFGGANNPKEKAQEIRDVVRAA